MPVKTTAELRPEGVLDCSVSVAASGSTPRLSFGLQCNSHSFPKQQWEVRASSSRGTRLSLNHGTLRFARPSWKVVARNSAGSSDLRRLRDRKAIAYCTSAAGAEDGCPLRQDVHVGRAAASESIVPNRNLDTIDTCPWSRTAGRRRGGSDDQVWTRGQRTKTRRCSATKSGRME